MSKKALILMSSPRKNGTTAWLAAKVAEQMTQKGVEVDTVDVSKLKSKNNGCISCCACQKSAEFRCVFDDDITPLVASLPNYDYVLFASPVYFYNMTAQLKLVVDRMFCLLKTLENGEYAHPFKDSTRFGLVCTCGDTEAEGSRSIVESFRQITGLIAATCQNLIMAESQMSVEKIANPEQWPQKAEQFCLALMQE